MDLFESARAVHIGIGVVVLASFWTAALVAVFLLGDGAATLLASPPFAAAR